MPLRILFGFLALVALAGAQGCGRRGGSHSSPSPHDTGAALARGKAVYARECEACHGALGGGGPIGPSLKNERLRRTYATVRSIVEDPQPPMPKLEPSVLTQTDVDDVSAYVESL